MKTLKIMLLMVVLFFMFAFVMPVHASDITTTETTTEITTTSETTTLLDGNVEETIQAEVERIKTYIVATVLSFIASGGLGLVAGVIFTKMKNKALEKVDEAVASNKISQGTADKATQLIEKGIGSLENKVGDLETLVKNEVGGMSESVQKLVDQYSLTMTTIAEGVAEYFNDEIE